MPTQPIINLQDRLSNYMDSIVRLFKPGAVITVIVRNPNYGDADVVIGNDDLDKAIEAINNMKNRKPDFEAGKPMPKPEERGK